MKVYQNNTNHVVQRHDILECVGLEMQYKLQNWEKPTFHIVIALYQSRSLAFLELRKYELVV